MEFILISPLADTVNTGSHPVGAKPRKNSAQPVSKSMFQNRLSDRASVLRQIISTIDLALPCVIEIEGRSVHILEATVTAIASSRILSLVAKVPPNKNESPLSTPQLETLLTNTVASFLRMTPGLRALTVKWVGRYHILAQSEAPIPDWLHPKYIRQIIEEPSSSNITALEFHIGWGNGTFIGLRNLPADIQTDAVSGLIDAQYIWSEADKLGLLAMELLGQVSATEDRITRSKLRSSQRASERLSTLVASHHVAYDDLVLNIQGPRFLVAESTLQAWNYDMTLSRIESRIASISEIVVKQDQRAGRRYNSVVEFILSGLGLLTIVDLALSFVSTAFSGAAEGVPGAQSSIGIFNFIRNSSADLFVLLTILFIGILIASILVWREK